VSVSVSVPVSVSVSVSVLVSVSVHARAWVHGQVEANAGAWFDDMRHKRLTAMTVQKEKDMFAMGSAISELVQPAAQVAAAGLQQASSDAGSGSSEAARRVTARKAQTPMRVGLLSANVSQKSLLALYDPLPRGKMPKSGEQNGGGRTWVHGVSNVHDEPGELAADWKERKGVQGVDATNSGEFEEGASDGGAGSKACESRDSKHLEKLIGELMRRMDLQTQELRELRATMVEPSRREGVEEERLYLSSGSDCEACRCRMRGGYDDTSSTTERFEEIGPKDLQIFR